MRRPSRATPRGGCGATCPATPTRRATRWTTAASCPARASYARSWRRCSARCHWAGSSPAASRPATWRARPTTRAAPSTSSSGRSTPRTSSAAGRWPPGWSPTPTASTSKRSSSTTASGTRARARTTGGPTTGCRRRRAATAGSSSTATTSTSTSSTEHHRRSSNFLDIPVACLITLTCQTSTTGGTVSRTTTWISTLVGGTAAGGAVGVAASFGRTGAFSWLEFLSFALATGIPVALMIQAWLVAPDGPEHPEDSVEVEWMRRGRSSGCGGPTPRPCSTCSSSPASRSHCAASWTCRSRDWSGRCCSASSTPGCG
ncbi:hypothetical protein NOCA1120174 [metagenome]|uniref:Uncharacterized protein n=1 Tax=metagenome TaxID=256318 RepID=A0A2P2C402_9ZZZZ